MRETLSVIIPTLNEAARLPALLGALRAQTRVVDEIIVADAGSSDATPEIARSMGAHVVNGGRPAAGRNAGARVASGVLLLFLDADVLPPPNFVRRMLVELRARQLDGGTPLLAPLEKTPANVLVCEIANVYLQVIQPVAPHASGFCILVRKSLHEAIGGFDETVLMSEDHLYAHETRSAGRFGLLTGVRIPVSLRRLDKEGFVRLAFKYLYCESFAVAGKPVHTVPFSYEFGRFDVQSGPALVDIAALRSHLGAGADPLKTISEPSRAVLESLGSLELSADGFDQALEVLPPAELIALRRYLHRRLTLLRRLPAQLEPMLEIARKRLPEVLWLDRILPEQLRPIFRRREDEK